MTYTEARKRELEAWESFDDLAACSWSEWVFIKAARGSWLENIITEQEFETACFKFQNQPRVLVAWKRWVDALKALHLAAERRARVSDRDVPTGCVA